MTKNNQIKYIPGLTAVLLFLLISSFFFLPSSSSAANCDDLSGDAKKQCEDLEKKAKVYENLIALKNKQQDTLETQMDSIDKEQAVTKSNLESIKSEIGELSPKIENLERDIQEKSRQVEIQKTILSKFMQSYYEYDQDGLLGLAVLDDNLNDVLNQTEYLGQSGVKVKDILSELQKSRDELLHDQTDLKEKKEEYNQKINDLSDKQEDLLANENRKQTLLSQTQGEEQKYRELLKRVEEQRKELFNFSEASNLNEIRASVENYPKPSSNLASTSWYFSQTDSRWGSKKIGNSSSLMSDYGCAITCVSMVFRKNGASTDPGKMAKEKIFYYDLIKWPATWPPGITLTSSVSHGNINWSTIDRKIRGGDPVIVYIKKTNGRGGHYILVTGKDSKDYIVHDPYFGSNLYLGTSKSLVGKLGVDSKVVVDQMIIYE